MFFWMGIASRIHLNVHITHNVGLTFLLLGSGVVISKVGLAHGAQDTADGH